MWFFRGAVVKNIQLPQITKDRLLDLKVGEVEYIIVPIIGITIKNFSILDVDEFILYWSPLKKGQSFYIGEEFADAHKNKIRYSFNKVYYRDDCPYKEAIWRPADQMQPHQSRFYGECLSVIVTDLDHCVMDTRKQLYGNTSDEFFRYYKDLVLQHNKLHNTNIPPSMDDYVLLGKVRRDK